MIDFGSPTRNSSSASTVVTALENKNNISTAPKPEDTTQSDSVEATDSVSNAEAELRSLPSPSTERDPPYHIFNKKRKWLLVYIVSIAGMFSPLSSNIYFPAINAISRELHVSTSLVALTITVYMVVQGLAPSLWGPLSDGPYGRRLIFTCTLGIYIGANLGLAFTANYPMLLVLRGVQAAGSAATISIGTGVIADIAAPSERGGFIGTNSGIRMIGQALGPLVGGIFNGLWGFRSIFWLLTVLGAVVLAMLLTFLPETHRAIAGNGTVPLHGFHRPWIYLLTSPPKEWTECPSEPRTSRPSLLFKEVLIPLRHLLEKDILALLTWGALIYTVWSMVTSSTTVVLIGEFPTLTDIELGLCFLPNGLGCVLGSISTGKLMDYNFKRVEKQYKLKHGIARDAKVKGSKDFPYERARLSPMPYFSIIFIFTTVLYGASYELNDVNRFAVANLIISLVLQFFIAFTATAIFSINSAMLVDCFPTGAAGAAAVNNLARCSLGALGVGVIQLMIDRIHIRNAFVILAAIVTACSPLVWIEWKWGERWRLERESRA